MRDLIQRPSTRLVLIALATAALLILIVLHVPYLNGPWYWKWHWRRLQFLHTFGGMLLAASPLVLALLLFDRWKTTAASIALLMISSVAVKLTAGFTVSDEFSLRWAAAVVRDPHTTGYFTDAGALATQDHWLGAYPQISPMFQVHTQSKPLAPVAYHLAWIDVMGFTDRAAAYAALGLALISAVSIVATWWLSRILGIGIAGSFYAAALFAAFPGFALFWPMFDPIYAVFSCALIGMWILALRSNRTIAAAAVGVILFVTTLCTYNVLVIGWFMLTAPWLIVKRPFASIARRFIGHSAVALLVLVLCYLALWSFTAFDPIGTFAQAWRNQQALLTRYAGQRPWPWTIPFDLLDFMLGIGWLVVLFLMLNFRMSDHLGLLLVLQLTVVAVSGLLPGETARVWIFLMPLVAVLAGRKMAQSTAAVRWLLIVGTLLLVSAVHQNMTFIALG